MNHVSKQPPKDGDEWRVWQREVIDELGVAPQFGAASECGRRTHFLAEYLSRNSLKPMCSVSAAVWMPAQQAVWYSCPSKRFGLGGMRRISSHYVPYGQQRNEGDAQHALRFIRPDQTLSIDVKPAADATLMSLKRVGAVFTSEFHEEFVPGNIKAHQRMIAQYAIAAARQGVVIGTDHAAESPMDSLRSSVMVSPTFFRLPASPSGVCVLSHRPSGRVSASPQNPQHGSMRQQRRAGEKLFAELQRHALAGAVRDAMPRSRAQCAGMSLPWHRLPQASGVLPVRRRTVLRPRPSRVPPGWPGQRTSTRPRR